MIGAALALWLACSALVSCLAGRFIRVGMAELQQACRKAERCHVPLRQSNTKTCTGCRHDDRTSGPINLVDLRPIQLCCLNQPRLWADRRCDHFQEIQP